MGDMSWCCFGDVLEMLGGVFGFVLVVFGWSYGNVFLELDAAFGLEGLAVGRVTGGAQVVSEGTG